jgi:gamma-glutamyl hercynylcysteine S-oxide synthase
MPCSPRPQAVANTLSRALLLHSRQLIDPRQEAGTTMQSDVTAGDIARRLAEARARTLLLIAHVTEDDLRRQHDPLMGPILWDLGHIAHFEELWLVDNLRGEIRFGEMPGMFNPFENPRARRGGLDLPNLAGVLALLRDTRMKSLAALDHAELDGESTLLRDGFVYAMVLQHEVQHNETMLQTLQLKQGEPYAAPRAMPHPPPSLEIGAGEMVRFPGGRVSIGTNDHSAAYDNERPAHEVELAPFWIDTAPVTNLAYLRFMEDGGYTRRELWSDAGWAWLQESAVEAPKYWDRDGNAWRYREMDRYTAAENDAPVCHVCWHEAEAYARWAGKRLPTEAEWEAAACWDPQARRSQPFPWGDEQPSPLHANLDQLSFGTAPVGSYTRNVSPIGCYGMIGDVWEWTASDFTAYPGFETFPYPEYSEVFFGGESKVLRGGSWATRPQSLRGTFRNWDFPIRRQIFAGFRCARDDGR